MKKNSSAAINSLNFETPIMAIKQINKLSARTPESEPEPVPWGYVQNCEEQFEC